MALWVGGSPGILTAMVLKGRRAWVVLLLFPCRSSYHLGPSPPALHCVWFFFFFVSTASQRWDLGPVQEPLTAALSSLQLAHTFLKGVGEAGTGCGGKGLPSVVCAPHPGTALMEPAD